MIELNINRKALKYLSRGKGIADGNAEISQSLEVTSDKSANFMGLRCTRFAMIVDNNAVVEIFIEEPGKLDISSAENILSKL